MNASEPLDPKPPSLIKMLAWALLAILVGSGLPVLIIYVLYFRHIQPQ